MKLCNYNFNVVCVCDFLYVQWASVAHTAIDEQSSLEGCT